VIQINVCDTRWRTAFVAPGFPRLLAYMYTVAIAHAARIHTQESYLSLSSARVYRGREYTCTNVCIGDVAHLPCDMRKLIVCSGIDALENQNPERPPPDRSPSTRTNEPAVSCRARVHSYPTDVREPRPLVSRLRSSCDAHRFSRRAKRTSLRSAKAKSFLVTIHCARRRALLNVVHVR